MILTFWYRIALCTGIYLCLLVVESNCYFPISKVLYSLCYYNKQAICFFHRTIILHAIKVGSYHPTYSCKMVLLQLFWQSALMQNKVTFKYNACSTPFTWLLISGWLISVLGLSWYHLCLQIFICDAVTSLALHMYVYYFLWCQVSSLLHILSHKLFNL